MRVNRSRSASCCAVGLAAAAVSLFALAAGGGESERTEPVAAASADAGVEPADAEVDPDAGTEPEPSEKRARPPLPVPLAVTVSGGVSLGAYQAGFLYYLSETIKKNPELVEYQVLTGASAGMINSLLALLSVGGEPQPDPQKNAFYRVWTGFLWEDLVDVERAPVFAMSSRAELKEAVDEVRELWRRGLSEETDIVLGATATRMRSVQTEVHEGLRVARQEEKFVFRVRGRGLGREPLVSNYADPRHTLRQPLLPFASPSELEARGESGNFDVLVEVLFATSALPMVFEAQRISFCTTPEGGVGDDEAIAALSCEEPTEAAEFADGALLDKWPLRLAYRTARAGLIEDEDGTVAWREVPILAADERPDDRLFFLYVDPEDSAYPPLPPPYAERGRGEDEKVGMFDQLGMFFGGYLVSNQARELYNLVEEHPEVRDRMRLAARDLPTASGLMANFFGFFDRKFRHYDFYLGMRGGRAFVESQLTSRVRSVTGVAHELELPEPPPGSEPSDSWRPYYCLRGFLDGDDRHPDACRGEEMRDFRILLQASLDRLHDHCRRLPEDEEIDHPRCREAFYGAPPPRVPGVPGAGAEDHWIKRQGETEFGYAMRLLEDYSFHFEDLGLDRDEASRAMFVIREELLYIVDEYGKKLPWGERQTVRVLAKPAFNFYKYAPPRAIVYLTAGKGAELGLSLAGRWIPSRWLRLNVGLQSQGLVQLASAVPNVLTLTPALGVELEVPQLNGPMVQLRGGARIGYQFSTTDGFTRRVCDAERFADDSVRCSAPVVQGVVSAAFYERIRLQIGVEWFPRWLPPTSRTKEHVWNGLIEVGWQWISPF
jgi:predicted acylesterase/phospholipase RssA